MSIKYVPVSTDYDCLVNRFHPSPLFNPIRQNVDRLVAVTQNSGIASFCDSGGLQLFNREDDSEKPCMVVVGVGIRKQNNRTIIDPIDVCRCYGSINAKFAFTLDYPVPSFSDSGEYERRLNNSCRWAKIMFDVRQELCPETHFMIPLHFGTKAQLHKYFERMSALQPDGYAFPGRGRWCLATAINIASTLCFLHSQKVQMVHLLGSSRRELIIIASAAIGLRMFKQLSFDSRTWNTKNFNTDLIKIDPQTLSQQKIENARYEDLSLIRPALLKRFGGSEVGNTKLLMLNNAYAITQYAERLAKIAANIVDLKDHLPFSGIPDKGLRRVLTAIDIFESYLDRGYGFIEKWLSMVWV